MGAHAVIMVNHFKVPVTKINWHNVKMLFLASGGQKMAKETIFKFKERIFGSTE